MSKLLIFQHVAYEILGTLDPLLRKSGCRIKYVNFGRNPQSKPKVKNYDGLIILGGPMNVDQTKEYPNFITEIESIQTAIENDIPVLGICLGAQLVAKALGAEVFRNPKIEIGWYDVTPTKAGRDDNLISKFGGTQKIFQWHGDTFELPHGAVHLARSELCENQAFRYADNVYGFQFHLEVEKRLVDRWLRVPENNKLIENSNGEIDPHKITEQTPIYIDNLIKLSNEVFGELIKQFEKGEKIHLLPSR